MALIQTKQSAAALLQLEDDEESGDEGLRRNGAPAAAVAAAPAAAALPRPSPPVPTPQSKPSVVTTPVAPTNRAERRAKRRREERDAVEAMHAAKKDGTAAATQATATTPGHRETIDLAQEDDDAAGGEGTSERSRAKKAKRSADAPPATVVPTSATSHGELPSALSVAAAQEEVDLLGPESTSHAIATPAPAPRSSLGFESMGGDGEGPPTGGKKGEKKAARRYFDGEDISIRCYNCGSVGHISTECTNPTVFKPCWLCGLRGHPAFRCTRELCFRCMKEGHQSRDCTSEKKTFIKCCFWCGSSQHTHTECMGNGSSADLSDVRCYVCGERGHLNCSSAASAVSAVVTAVSCANCGLPGHDDTVCAEERMPLNLTVDNFGNVWSGTGAPPTDGGKNNRTPRKDWLQDVECFYCNQKGHRKLDCPLKQSDQERFGHAGGFRRQSFPAGGGQHRGPNQDRRYSDYNNNNNNRSPHSSAPYSRNGRERERSGHHQSRSNSTSSAHGRDRDRDRDFMDRSHDRRSSNGNSGGGSGGGFSRSNNDRDRSRDRDSDRSHRDREGRSRERTDKHQRDSRSAPPAKRDSRR